MARKRRSPTLGMRLTDDERNIVDAYGEATGQTRSRVVHVLIKEATVKMAAVVIRADIARDLAAPGAADWTPDLPDAAKDREMREQRERKAQKKA